jgi:glycosyltransferase involved in cell wall biosynthesis
MKADPQSTNAGTQSQRPHVTIVAHDIGPVGGMERQLTELISGLLGAGHQLTVVSRTCDVPPHARLHWIRVPGPARPFAVAYPLFFVLGSLLVWLRGSRLIHSTGAIVLNRTSVNTVHFCHHAVARLPGFSRTSRPGLAYRINAWIAAAMSRVAERWCYRPRRTGRLVGVSAGVVRELRQHFPSMGECIRMIPNGVDTDVFHPLKETSPNGAPEMLHAIFVGSEWEGKGLRVAIEALDGLPGVQLTVIGDGDTDTYRELTDKLGLSGRVSFIPATPEVTEWYRKADVFVLPTAYETFSLATHEAAASGLPLLVTRVNGVEDLLRDGDNGWFIDRDPQMVRHLLQTLKARPLLRRRMGAAARKESLRFSWSQVVRSYQELYGEPTDARR